MNKIIKLTASFVVLDTCLQARIYLYSSLLIGLVEVLKEALRLLVALVFVT